ncbi:MAG: N-glycosylase/DNA lyase [archaeon]
MNSLITEVKKLQKTEVAKKVNSRLKEFESYKNKDSVEWFSELCFCILTANSKARTAIAIQNELGSEGFCSICFDDLSACIRRNKHRFHNNKAKYIIEARGNTNIKEIVKDTVRKHSEAQAREWLVENIKGLGYKEASHFLRNVGYKNLAILDRHILNLLKENEYIKEKPKTLTKKNYLEIEEVFGKVAKELNMPIAELDLYMWYMKAGDVLK